MKKRIVVNQNRLMVTKRRPPPLSQISITQSVLTAPVYNIENSSGRKRSCYEGKFQLNDFKVLNDYIFFSLRKICKELKELREKKIVNYELFSGSNTLPPCSNSNSCLAGTAAAVSLDETSKTFPTKRGGGE